jgi:hypothetical protein
VIVFIIDNFTLMFDSQNIVRIKTGTRVGADKGTNKGEGKGGRVDSISYLSFCYVLFFHLSIS